ncbi:MAG: alpha/beta hydrolase [Phycisphaerae bacterium]|nr:alpha/beta hydrolase [Phycisphaerae bacterium]
MHVNEYGTSGRRVIVLHGGPGAAGNAEPIAKGLADEFRVLEPYQRSSGKTPLTVATHIADIKELIETKCTDECPAIIGESWGAMLALAFATEHPALTGPIVLVGCGTFDPQTRRIFEETGESRMDEAQRKRISSLEQKFTDPDERRKAYFAEITPLYAYAPLPRPPKDLTNFDMRGHSETWNDMLQLQETGVYPKAFTDIKSPVLMLHGDYDPHPGLRTRDLLQQYIPQLEYHELEKCGHSPWEEKFARDDFFAILHEWLK